MKGFVYTIVLIILSYQITLAQVFDPKQIHQSCKYFEHYTTKASPSPAGKHYDVSYCCCFWEVDPNIRYIKGNILYHFTIIHETTDSLIFDFSDTLQIDSVWYHSTSLNYSKNDDLLIIYLQSSLAEGATDSITIYYQGVPRISDDRSFVQDYHDTANVPSHVIWTLSQQYGAKEWWPCNQNLNDKIDSIDIYVKAPSQYKTASIGLLQSEIENNGLITTHWKHKYPVTAYLVAFATTNYTVTEQYHHFENGDSLLIQNYFYEEDTNFLDELYYLPPALDLYYELFGDYPFINEKYGHTQFHWPGGMEHQTMSFMYNLSHHLTVHELAHQWFGDYLTCGSWEDIWLNEGFADFCVGLTYEYFFDQYYWMPWKKECIDKITSEPDGSVYCSDTTDIYRIFNNRLSYKKGSYLLNMLRWELGDSAFFHAINEYLYDGSNAYSFSKTHNLINHFEMAGDTSLTEFFNDWYYGEGYPLYNITWQQDLESKDVSITVNQSTTHNSVNFYEMHIPIKFCGGNRDTIIVFHHLFDGQVFQTNPGIRLDSLQFDPELIIVTKNPVINSIQNQISESTKVKVYPNPTSNIIHLEANMNDIIKDITIYNINGQLIRKVPDKASYTHQIQLSDFPSGIYTITFNINYTPAYKTFSLTKCN